MISPSQRYLPTAAAVHEVLNYTNHEFMDRWVHEFMKKVHP
jgi:hypothetical protein